MHPLRKHVPFDLAHTMVQELSGPLGIEFIPVRSAEGRVLAVDAEAAIDVPPFPRAMMDGFAIHVDALDDSPTRVVLGIVAAGAGDVANGSESDLCVSRNEAVRIMTGAAVPQGANAVARFEWCDELPDGSIRLKASVKPGESIQPLGSDGAKGQVVVPRGTVLKGRHLAVCQSFGVAKLAVYKQPRIAIVVTGSELVFDAHQPLQFGQIYGCNDLFIRSAVEEDGGEVVSVSYVPDQMEKIHAAIEWATSQADFIIVTGGASMGDYDYVPEVLHRLGCTPAFNRVWMRPGAPFVAAQCHNAVIFSLSGNPAACYVQFELLIRAAIRKSIGIRDCPFPASGVLCKPIVHKPTKHMHVLRAQALVQHGCVMVDTDLAQSTGVISSLALANCLIRVDGGEADAGTTVPLRWIQ